MIIITETTETDMWHDLIMWHQRVVFPNEHEHHADTFSFATLGSVGVITTIVNSLLKVGCLNQQFT